LTNQPLDGGEFVMLHCLRDRSGHLVVLGSVHAGEVDCSGSRLRETLCTMTIDAGCDIVGQPSAGHTRFHGPIPPFVSGEFRAAPCIADTSIKCLRLGSLLMVAAKRDADK
jgi:hypothetical protein